MAGNIDFSQRLSSGITLGEASQRAAEWWGEFRGMIPREFTQQRIERVRTGRGVPLLRIKSEDWDRACGNILRGAVWDELSPRERLVVTTYWHNGVFLGQAS